MYLYTAFGLIIESSLLLPELSPSSTEAPADVVIRRGEVPLALENATTQGVLFQINLCQFLLSIDGIARYLVNNGNEIVVEADANADEASVRLFLLSSPLGALLHQRGMFPLHGSCIETEKGAVIFVGVSGAGKSTTAAAFHKRGYPILADDITVVQTGEGNVPLVIPGYPQMKLWARSLHKLDEDMDSLEKVRPQLEKYSLPLREGFRSEPLAVHAVYVLSAYNRDEITLTPITGMKKIRLLNRHIYRINLLDGMGKVNPNLAAFAQSVRVCMVKRSDSEFHLEKLVELLLEDFNV